VKREDRTRSNTLNNQREINLKPMGGKNGVEEGLRRGIHSTRCNAVRSNTGTNCPNEGRGKGIYEGRAEVPDRERKGHLIEQLPNGENCLRKKFSVLVCVC